MEGSWITHSTSTAKCKGNRTPLFRLRNPDVNVFRRMMQRFVRQEVKTNNTCEGRAPTNFTDAGQWKCHICSCGTTAMLKISRYRRRIRNTPIEKPWRISCRSVVFINLLSKGTTVNRLSSSSPILRVNMMCPFFPFLFYILRHFVITCVSKSKVISLHCKILWNYFFMLSIYGELLREFLFALQKWSSVVDFFTNIYILDLVNF